MTRFLRLFAVVVVSSALFVALTMSAASLAHAQTQPTASPGQTDLRINELMPSNATTLVDPDEPDETPDWIEIYNPTAADVSLTGLAVTDDPSELDKHIITQTLTISANGFLILYADEDPKQGAAHLTFRLSSSGEYFGLSIIDGSGTPTLVDAVEFPAVPTDLSYARSSNGAGVWRIGRPTPGKSNTANPPYVSGVTTPTVNADTPAPTDAFTVTAIITDDVGVTTATLIYMTATAPYTAATPVWVRVPMTTTGGDQYAAQLPAVPIGTLVKYYVEAGDIFSDTSRFPLPGREYGYLAGYAPPRLLINKIVTVNNTVPDPDEPGETPDWVELYNPGAVDILLDGLSISNDRNEPLKFRLPPGIRVPAGGLLTLLIDGDAGQNKPTSGLIWHVGVGNVLDRLDNGNDYIALYGGEGTAVVDAFDWDDPPRWGAFGRIPNGGEWSAKVAVLAMNTANLLLDQEVYMPAVNR
ncbi:MAG TPA: lamin tail domain-containing protein [Chloroflexi bacterium]|nr:lamin tail domain-containing protein [Chloroflexota bacterium]